MDKTLMYKKLLVSLTLFARFNPFIMEDIILDDINKTTINEIIAIIPPFSNNIASLKNVLNKLVISSGEITDKETRILSIKNLRPTNENIAVKNKIKGNMPMVNI